MNNLSQMLQNPKTMVLKKFMTEILGNKVLAYEDILIRMSVNLVTESDIKAFALMVNDILEVGYRKAVDDYKVQLKEIGIDVSIK